jgi:Recombination endonuclease VII
MRTTKVCRTCKNELPISDFREGRRRCFRCEQKTYSQNWSQKTHIICNKCGVEKPISEYYKGHKRCKECYSKDYKDKKPSFLDKKDYMLKYTYGQNFGLNEYNNLLEKQNTVCAICLNPNTNGRSDTNNLYVDHDHKTGKVRGLLCSNCNRSLGLVGDNIQTLQSMIEYLKKH